jgi:hypothetical protein
MRRRSTSARAQHEQISGAAAMSTASDIALKAAVLASFLLIAAVLIGAVP